MKILDLIPFDISYPIALAIIHSLWQSLIVMFVISLISKLRYFDTSDKKYLLHLAGLFSLFILFIVNIGLIISRSNSMTELGFTGTEFVLFNLNEYLSERSGLFLSVHEMIASIWAIGVFVFLLKFSFGNIFLQTIKNTGLRIEDRYSALVLDLKQKLGIQKNIEFIKSNKISIPFTMGFIKPIIVFPLCYFTKLSPAQFESILLHELVHIKRQDYLINQIQSFIECILFFNPFTWYLSSQIRKYREFCCDDIVQSQIEDKTAYLKALYTIASASGMTEKYSVALFQNKSELVMRVKRMLNQKTEKHTYKPFFSISLFVFLSIGISTISNGNTTMLNNEIKTQVEDFVNKTIEISAIEVKDFQSESIENSEISSVILSSDVPIIKDNFTILDTVPDNAKIKELEEKLEAKAIEMEELAARMEKEFAQNMEVEAEKMEELAQELEERMEARAEEWSQKFENSELVYKIEELTEQLEEKIEAQLPKIEELNEAEMKAFEIKIEKLAQEIEKYIDKEGNVSNEAKVEELRNQIKEESKKLKDVMSDFEKRHKEVFESGEIKALEEEIRAMTKELSAMEFKHQDIMDPISKELQAEMKVLQEQIQANLKPIGEELKVLMQEKALEMEKIAKELEKEKQKQKKQ